MTAYDITTEDAQTPYIVAMATVHWVVELPDDVDGVEMRTDDEFADILIDEMDLERRDTVTDYSVDVSSMLHDGGHTEDDTATEGTKVTKE